MVAYKRVIDRGRVKLPFWDGCRLEAKLRGAEAWIAIGRTSAVRRCAKIIHSYIGMLSSEYECQSDIKHRHQSSITNRSLSTRDHKQLVPSS